MQIQNGRFQSPKSHVGLKFPRDTDGALFMVPNNQSDKIVEA
jgi:hypothetical protein